MKGTKLLYPFHNTLLSTAQNDTAWLATHDRVVAKGEGLDSYFYIETELVMWKVREYIPNDRDLGNMILHDNHNSTIEGHFGRFKTLQRLRPDYRWHRMEEYVKDYVRACNTCQRDKPSRHRRYSMYEPLEVPYRPSVFYPDGLDSRSTRIKRL